MIKPIRTCSTRWIAGKRKAAAAVLGLLGLGGSLVQAQQGNSHPIASVNFGGSGSSNTSGYKSRTLQGKVQDSAGKGIKGALVYLKDAQSASIKSVTTNDDGTYRFVQLSQNKDYQLWAQADAKKSPTKSISSFDTQNEITMILKVQ
jgi:hypothetical protein